LVMESFEAFSDAIVRAMTATAGARMGRAPVLLTLVIPRLETVKRVVFDKVTLYLEHAATSYVQFDDVYAKHDENRKRQHGGKRYRVSATEVLSLRMRDEGTRLMYALKVSRFVIQLFALWGANRMYAEAYIRHVASNPPVGAAGGASLRPPPPSLSSLLLVFLGIDATAQLVTLLVLVMLSRLGSSSSSSSYLHVIDDEFLQTFLIDYFVTTATIALLGYLLGRLMRRKAYFDLQGSGLRASEGYAAMMAGVCFAVDAIPFFLLL